MSKKKEEVLFTLSFGRDLTARLEINKRLSKEVFAHYHRVVTRVNKKSQGRGTDPMESRMRMGTDIEQEMSKVLTEILDVAMGKTDDANDKPRV